jgi:hypothetical protein
MRVRQVICFPKKLMPVGPFQLAVAAAILCPTTFFVANALAIVLSRAIVVAVFILLLPVEQGVVKIPISEVVDESCRLCPLLLLSAFLARIRSVHVSCIQPPRRSLWGLCRLYIIAVLVQDVKATF